MHTVESCIFDLFFDLFYPQCPKPTFDLFWIYLDLFGVRGLLGSLLLLNTWPNYIAYLEGTFFGVTISMCSPVAVIHADDGRLQGILVNMRVFTSFSKCSGPNMHSGGGRGGSTVEPGLRPFNPPEEFLGPSGPKLSCTV